VRRVSSILAGRLLTGAMVNACVGMFFSDDDDPCPPAEDILTQA
jgi:hypothetical protein